jgi:hypothetical protein
MEIEYKSSYESREVWHKYYGIGDSISRLLSSGWDEIILKDKVETKTFRLKPEPKIVYKRWVSINYQPAIPTDALKTYLDTLPFGAIVEVNGLSWKRVEEIL